MASSTVPVVKATILTALAAAPGLAGVQAEWAHPGQNIQPESIFFGTTELAEKSAQLGNQRRDEEYTLNLWVVIHQDGDDAQAAEERSWALVTEVENYLRADASLGLTPTYRLMVVQLAGAEQDNFIEDNGRTAQVRVSIGVEARI